MNTNDPTMADAIFYPSWIRKKKLLDKMSYRVSPRKFRELQEAGLIAWDYDHLEKL